MIIDVHTHFIPESYIRLAEKDPQAARATSIRNERGELFIKPLKNCPLPLGFGPFEPAMYEVKAKLASMDHLGVDMGAISAPSNMFFYSSEPREALQLAKMWNDGVAQMCRAYPARFVGLATVPMQSPDLAIAEMERAMTELGFKGVEIGTSINGRDLDQPEFFPFFRRAQELGAFVMMHPSACAICAGRAEKYYFQNVMGYMLESAIALGSLIFSGVLERLPKLKLYSTHGGGFMPYQIGRLDHVRRARRECANLIPRDPSEYLKRVNFDSITHSPLALSYLISLVGIERILLGTDDPMDMGERKPLHFVESIPGLSKADRAAILGGNAARLLSLTA
jgi:aminocarboxymuconate-semialdehyde decarboxylase